MTLVQHLYCFIINSLISWEASLNSSKMALSLFSFIKKIILASICLCLSGTSYAIVVDGIYTTVLEVQSQQSHNREATFNDALMDVLLKASGDRDVLQNHQIISRLFPAEQYVVSFSYSENPAYTEFLRQQSLEISNKQSPADNESQGSLPNTWVNAAALKGARKPLPYLIEVNFSENALENAMRNAGIPIWGSVRPNTMFWVVYEEEGQRQLLGQTTRNLFLDFLNHDATRYALPIEFPFADQVDLAAVDIFNLWGLFPDAIDQAKTRYRSDGQLMMRVYKSLSNTWNANWSFSISGENYRSSIAEVDLPRLSEAVVAHVAGVLVDRFSIKPDQAHADGAVQIEVTDIHTFKDYVSLQNFLEKLAAVKRVSVEWVEGLTVGLSLELNTSSTQFFEYLTLSGKLIRLNNATDIQTQSFNTTIGVPEQPIHFLPQPERFKWQKSASELTAK